MNEFEKKIAELKEKQKSLLELHRQYENAKNEYKAETKAVFGLADGEQMNVLDVAEAVGKLIDLKSQSA